MVLCRRVEQCHKDSTTGFYCIDSCKQNNKPNTFVHCEQLWYRIKTPGWMYQLWDDPIGDFIDPKPKTKLFNYLKIQFYDMDGKHFYLPRNVINTMGNLNMFEYMIQDSSTDTTLLMKVVKTPQNPIGFECSIDPPCNYNICECRDAYNQKLCLIGKINNRKNN